jgi:hypothetical protein
MRFLFLSSKVVKTGIRAPVRAIIRAARSTAIFTCMMALSGLLFMTCANAAGGLVSHRAFYELELGGRQQNSHIVNVRGRAAFSIERDCTGWRSIEDYMIQFVVENGGSDNLVSHFESWESDNGDMYSFDIFEESSFEGRKEFGGFVQMADDLSGQAFFTMEPDAALDLPKKTMFPVQHINKMIKDAEAGATIFGATLFTGAEPDSALMRTNTVFGGWREIPASDIGKLGEDGFWQINIAYYRPSSKAAEPQYEIQFELQRNGVVRKYEIIYEDFSIAANLTNAEPIDAAECR